MVDTNAVYPKAILTHFKEKKRAAQESEIEKVFE